MIGKVLLIALICTATVTITSGQSVSLLNITLRHCHRIMTQFQAKFPVMNTQLENLKSGLLILYNYEMTDKDIQAQYALIYKINQMISSLPSDAVQRLSSFQALRLVSSLKALNAILPSTNDAFRSRVGEYGGIGKMLEEASVPLMKILQALADA